MNNRELYKGAMSGVRHSDDAIERIFDMTVDKKKTNSALLLKRLACTTLAFAVLIGSGFGTNALIQRNKADEPLTVIVAYAGDNGKLYLGNKQDQKLFFGLHIAPYGDKAACDEAAKKWQADKTAIKNELDNNDEDSSGIYGAGGLQCYNKELGKETAYCYAAEGGFIELNLEDYSDVKSFKVNNESKYGLLQFEYDCYQEIYYDDSDVPVEELTEDLQNHEFVLTGDELRYSQNSKRYECGLGKYKQNKGYSLSWWPSDELGYAIGDNPYFDLTQIKDTVTFTVEFNDGTVKTASLNLYFDSEGYMHFE